MSRAGANIFAGDLLRAVVRLEAGDEPTRRAIADLLGLAAPPQPRAETPPGGPPAEPEILPPPPPPPPSPRGDSLPSRIEPSGGAVELWLPGVPRLTIAGAGAAPEPSVEPLLAPHWTRAILSAALSTDGNDGPLDVERIVETLAAGETPATLPRRPRPTTRRGVQVLVDRGRSMAPFAADQAWLRTQLKLTIGADAVTVLRFAGCPARGVKARAGERWRAYRAPLPGTPVLLLTDLGIGRPLLADGGAGEREWLDFAAGVRRAGCPLMAFVPYAPARWPRGLRHAMVIVEWDRRTSAVTIRNLTGRAHKVAV